MEQNESLKMDPQKYSQLILDKGAEATREKS